MLHSDIVAIKNLAKVNKVSHQTARLQPLWQYKLQEYPYQHDFQLKYKLECY